MKYINVDTCKRNIWRKIKYTLLLQNIYIQRIFFLQIYIEGYERKWHVETDYKYRSSVITTLVHIVPDTCNNGNLQRQKFVTSFVV